MNLFGSKAKKLINPPTVSSPTVSSPDELRSRITINNNLLESKIDELEDSIDRIKGKITEYRREITNLIDIMDDKNITFIGEPSVQASYDRSSAIPELINNNSTKQGVGIVDNNVQSPPESEQLSSLKMKDSSYAKIKNRIWGNYDTPPQKDSNISVIGQHAPFSNIGDGSSQQDNRKITPNSGGKRKSRRKTKFSKHKKSKKGDKENEKENGKET